MLITDGENHGDDAVEVARKAAQGHTHLGTDRTGTPEGAPIQIDGDFIKGRTAKWWCRSSTRRCWSRSPRLRAERTCDQKPVDRSGRDRQEHRRMRRATLRSVRFEEFNEQYQYLACGCRARVLLRVLDVFILSRRNSASAPLSPRTPQRRGTVTSGGAVALGGRGFRDVLLRGVAAGRDARL